MSAQRCRRQGCLAVFGGLQILLLATCGAPSLPRVQAEPRRPHAAELEGSALPSVSPARAEEPAQPVPAGPLASFHRALERSRREGTKTRILFIGDSHTAADYMTGRVRERLQAEYGDGGPGFIIAGKPWRSYRHSRAELLEARGLKATYVRKRPDVEALPLGLSGVALSTNEVDGEREPVAVRMLVQPAALPSGRATQGELYLLMQPGGATLELTLDGRPLEPFSTRADVQGAGYAAFAAPDDQPHELTIRSSGRVTLFGVVAELAGGGVVVDTLGVPGARARAQLYWDQALFREHVARRAPDLWVQAFGTNESTDVTQPIAEYAARLRQVLANMRAAAPQASCLLVGPTDFPERVAKGKYQARERTLAINALQGEIAEEAGCAFFDTIASMGGPLSMLDWVKQEPPLGARDLVHLTRSGYVTLGDRIADALSPGAPAANPTASARRGE